MVKNGGVSALTWQKINDFNCVIISDVRHVWHYILIRTFTKYINVVPIDVFFPHYIQQDIVNSWFCGDIAVPGQWLFCGAHTYWDIRILRSNLIYWLTPLTSHPQTHSDSGILKLTRSHFIYLKVSTFFFKKSRRGIRHNHLGYSCNSTYSNSVNAKLDFETLWLAWNTELSLCNSLGGVSWKAGVDIFQKKIFFWIRMNKMAIFPN